MGEDKMADIQYDSKTGERLPENWRTPKFDVPDMTGLNRNALAQIFRDNKTEEALKYVEAAIQMQGQRGYQNALKSGEAAEKAIAKYGPMMFYRSPNAFAPSVKALTPPPVIPNAAWNSANTNTGAPGYFQLGKGGVNVPRPSTTPQNKVMNVRGGLYRVPPTGSPETLIQPPEQREPTPFSLTTDEESGAKLTQKLTAKENSERLAAIAATERTKLAAEVKPWQDEYAANESKIKSGDERSGFANIYSRKNANAELAKKIREKGFEPPKNEVIKIAPKIKRPTKAIAADYVQRLGREKAIEALKQEGYDTSGYAD
jgi:hypothetical protein